jgi:hypothetical protein
VGAVAEFLAAATLAVAPMPARFLVEFLMPCQPSKVAGFEEHQLSKAHTLPAEVLEK